MSIVCACGGERGGWPGTRTGSPTALKKGAEIKAKPIVPFIPRLPTE